ncbi:MAG: phosphate transport system regulatory protein PhoU [Oscillospiraceae bacterium]|jgi:phosphate transport system protein|nr:phosphate transport system regulatory protein PhoU [Oscillospiraceae bacterium]
MGARPTFDNELELLNIDLIKMGALVESSIEKSIEAFKKQDKDLALSVVKGDGAIDEIEKSIETRCLSLLLRQQPVARDLRAISTALKMITDMERIGDNAADIAELVIMIRGDHIFTMVEHIPKMASIAVSMVHDSIESYVKNNLDLAKKTIDRDDDVDSLFNKVKLELVTFIQHATDDFDRAIDFLMIAKYLERIADHAVNICEWVEFYKTGTHKKTKIM